MTRSKAASLNAGRVARPLPWRDVSPIAIDRQNGAPGSLLAAANTEMAGSAAGGDGAGRLDKIATLHFDKSVLHFGWILVLFDDGEIPGGEFHPLGWRRTGW